VLVEHLFGELDEEVSGETTDVLASLSCELDGNLALQLVRR